MKSQDIYFEQIDIITRRPIRPRIGIPLFFFLFAIALFAKRFFDAEYVGLVLLLLLFVFPYYVLQLLMKWRMERHFEQTRKLGIPPTYVPTNRVWVSVYIFGFFIVAQLFMGIEKLLQNLNP